MSTANINGIDVFYHEVGAGIPCLVFHGLLGDHTHMHPWLDPLGNAMHLVYFDYRNFGRSSRPAIETLTFDQLCADADGLRAQLGFDKVALMGSSFGGCVELHYALNYPERVSHLLLMDTTPAFNYGTEIMANAQRKGATAEMMAVLEGPDPTDDADLQRQVKTILPLYFHKYNETIANRVVGNTVWSASGNNRCGELLANFNLTARLKDVHAPTLIIVGRDDYVTPPAQAEILHEHIPGSQLVVFEHSGHLPYVEESDVFFAAVRGWLSQAS
ncbi:MAG: alpha/beta fold hydrolase [Planctomycetota bacterium]|jgi:proline iminopeptidase